MPIAQATELANSKSGVTAWITQHDPLLDDLAIRAVAEILQQHITPMVAIEPLDAKPWAGQVLHQSDSLLLDLSGVVHLFGDLNQVIQSIHGQLRPLGLRPKIAIAHGVAAAWAHAHFNPQEDFIDDATALNALPVQALRIAPETVHTLSRLGVRQIGDLLRLPRSGLSSRLGKPLVKRIAQVLGETDEPLSIHHADAEHVSSMELEYPTDDQCILMHRLEHLVDEIIASLAASQRGALRLACRLDLTDHSQLDFNIGLFAPTLNKKHLVCLIGACVETRRIPANVTRITLSVSLSGSLRTSQSGLFDNDEDDLLGDRPSGDQSLPRFIDAISGRLGRDAVLGVRRTQDPLPEKAFQLYSLTDHRGRQNMQRRLKQRSSTNEPEPSTDRANSDVPRHSFRPPRVTDAGRRPMVLLPHPLPLTAVTVATKQKPPGNHPPIQLPVQSLPVHSLPVAFRLGGRVHRIVRHRGPERIETAWWSGPTIRRDYYQVETDSGRRWWIFRTLGDCTWSLHGHFG
ncbi:DNA polymerase IV [Stieleria varia]|uniref:DNA polymerase IV n=2 Tax=Stieleria varia TaxID=2528005 RepID=A0A5C6AZA0_9BACT|nr:DNA polymerase IV [Stieleria varia]